MSRIFSPVGFHQSGAEVQLQRSPMLNSRLGDLLMLSPPQDLQKQFPFWENLSSAIALIDLIFAGQREDCKTSSKLLPSKDSEALVGLEKSLKTLLSRSSKNYYGLFSITLSLSKA